VFAPPGYRDSTEEEKARQAPAAPSHWWEQDHALRLGDAYSGRKVEKPCTPFTFCKKERTFPGSKDEMYAMLPGLPAFLYSKWRKERSDVRYELDKLRHDVYSETPSPVPEGSKRPPQRPTLENGQGLTTSKMLSGRERSPSSSLVESPLIKPTPFWDPPQGQVIPNRVRVSSGIVAYD